MSDSVWQRAIAWVDVWQANVDANGPDHIADWAEEFCADWLLLTTEELYAND